MAHARGKRLSLRKQLIAGLDPSQQKRLDELAQQSQANTFDAIAAELLEKKKREGKASNIIGKREWLFSLASDGFRNRPIIEVTPLEVLAELRKVEANGLLETAKRMRSAYGEVF